MTRLFRVVVASAAIVVLPAPVLAESPLLGSATRLAKRAAQQLAPARVAPARSAAAAQGSLATSGMSKKKKLLFGIAAGLGFVGAVWAIDHGVEDNTPSSRGTRQD